MLETTGAILRTAIGWEGDNHLVDIALHFAL